MGGCGEDILFGKPGSGLVELFAEALDFLRREKFRQILIGALADLRFDIEAAAKAGLATIALLCGGTDENVLRKTGAIAIYRDPADVLAHYDRLLV